MIPQWNLKLDQTEFDMSNSRLRFTAVILICDFKSLLKLWNLKLNENLIPSWPDHKRNHVYQSADALHEKILIHIQDRRHFWGHCYFEVFSLSPVSCDSHAMFSLSACTGQMMKMWHDNKTLADIVSTPQAWFKTILLVIKAAVKFIVSFIISRIFVNLLVGFQNLSNIYLLKFFLKRSTVFSYQCIPSVMLAVSMICLNGKHRKGQRLKGTPNWLFQLATESYWTKKTISPHSNNITLLIN